VILVTYNAYNNAGRRLPLAMNFHGWGWGCVGRPPVLVTHRKCKVAVACQGGSREDGVGEGEKLGLDLGRGWTGVGWGMCVDNQRSPSPTQRCVQPIGKSIRSSSFSIVRGDAGDAAAVVPRIAEVVKHRDSRSF
jgi:hypothetical protein